MNDELDIRALLGTVKRQAKLIVTIVSLIVVLAAIIGFSITPKYQATSLMYVDTAKTSLLEDNIAFSNNSTDNTKVTSEVEIIKSDGVILDLIDSMALVSDNEFGVKLGRLQKVLTAIGLSSNAAPSGSAGLASVIGNVQDAITVQRRGLTYIISISAKSSDPEKAALLANGLSKSYIERQLKSKISNIEISLGAVQNQVREIEGNVLATQKNLDDFIATNLDRIAQANSGTSLVELQANLADLRQQKIQADSQRSLISKGLGGGVWLSDVSGLKSEALRELESQRAQITGRISSEAYDSLSLIDLREQLAGIQGEIVKESEVILDGINQTIASVDNSIVEFQSQLNSTVLSGDIVLPDEIGSQLYRLSQQSKNTNTQYQTLLAKAQELEAESLLQIADSRVISPAIAPNSPVSPNLKLILAGAGLFALGLGVAVAFILENYIGGFTSAAQVEAITKIRGATSVRKLTGPKAATKSISELVIKEPLSMFAESIRRIRTAMQIALQNQTKVGDAEAAGTVIMVSSSLPAEGKSSTALSLARTLAFSGAKTIIIDCDVRKPSIAVQLGVTSEKGLSKLFSNKVTSKSLAENVVVDNLSNLHTVLGYRNELKDVQFMLGFQPFEAIIEAAKKEYEFVILDTPPIGPVADALTLTAYSDVVLFVVRWAKTSQRSVLESLKLVGGMAPNVPVLTVLNQVEGDTDQSYTRYSGYYSDF